MCTPDGSSFALLLQPGAESGQQQQEIRELTKNATEPAVEAAAERSKEITLKLIRIIESWAEQRDSFWATRSGSGMREALTSFSAQASHI